MASSSPVWLERHCKALASSRPEMYRLLPVYIAWVCPHDASHLRHPPSRSSPSFFCMRCRWSMSVMMTDRPVLISTVALIDCQSSRTCLCSLLPPISLHVRRTTQIPAVLYSTHNALLYHMLPITPLQFISRSRLGLATADDVPHAPPSPWRHAIRRFSIKSANDHHK